MPLSTGQVLNNRYRIVKLLGQGGFGAVYKAWDLQMQAACALKENLDTSTEAQEQFVREARLLYNLIHPNLPRTHDHFAIPGQGQYLVMDYIEGENLKEIVEQRGALPVDQVLGWIGQICDALTYLHSQQPQVIHRDIKPANIKITPKGDAVLVDFGIAKLYDPKKGTTTGARAYTPGYAPPEQHSGKLTDVQSDIYSLGATSWTLLTGLEPPDTNDIFAGLEPTPQPAQQVNPLVPPQVGAAVERAMQLRRTDRPASMAEFKAALFQSPVPTPAPAQPVPLPPPTVQTTATVQAPPKSTSVAGAQPVKKGQPVDHSQEHKFSWRTWLWLLLVGATILGLTWFVMSQNRGNQLANSLAKEISVYEAAKMREQGAFILDVRTPEEWNEVHIPDSTLIPLDELPNRVNEVPKDQDVVVVCRSGNRSQQGRDILLNAGYEQVTSMTGGVNEWKTAGYPTVSGP